MRQRQELPEGTRVRLEKATLEALDKLSHLADDIKLIRQREGMGQTQFGHFCGVSRIEVWHWEQGNRKPKNPIILLALLMWAEELKKDPNLRLLPLNPLASRYKLVGYGS